MTHPEAALAPDLAPQVQHNCDIADAQFARDYTMCIYLLKMRELFRWENGLAFGDTLPKEALGDWLRAREQRWEDLETSDFRSMNLGAGEFEPFASRDINRHLLEHDLVYSGGIGGSGRPHFFLGRLLQREERHGHPILVVGRELARDLAAPPAMTQDGVVYVRRESLQRLLWERIEEWRWHKRDAPMGRAATHYGFDDDFEAALEAMTDAEVETAVLHELGELEAGRQLGEQWEALLAQLFRGRLEYLVRAVRDHLADTAITLPRLIEREAAPSIHFYMANLAGLRREIFPALVAAYGRWHNDGDWRPLADAVSGAHEHWSSVAERLLELYREYGEMVAPQLEARQEEFYF